MSDVGTLPQIILREAESTSQIVHQLAAHGVSLFRGVGGRNEVLRSARSMMTVRIHRDSDANGMTVIAPGAIGSASSMVGFTDRELRPHTEGSAVDRPCRLLTLACELPAQVGGLIRLVDGYDLYQELAEHDPEMLKALSAPRSAYFGRGAGHLGAVFQANRHGRIRIRLRLDDHIQFAPTVDRYVDRLRSLVQSLTQEIRLGEGEGYVLANDRWMHGRTRFSGPRRMLRVIGHPLPGHCLSTGFAATAALEALRA
jgi:hypothetical protein